MIFIIFLLLTVPVLTKLVLNQCIREKRAWCSHRQVFRCCQPQCGTTAFDLMRANFSLCRDLLVSTPGTLPWQARGLRRAAWFPNHNLLRTQTVYSYVKKAHSYVKQARQNANMGEQRRTWLAPTQKGNGRYRISRTKRDIAWACREGVRNVRAQPEVELVKDVKSSKTSFCKYLSSKRKSKDSMVPRLRGVDELVTLDMEKTEVLFLPHFHWYGFPSDLSGPWGDLLTVCGSKAVERGGVTDHLS